MKENKDFYITVLKSGQILRYGSLELLKTEPQDSVECYLKAEYQYTYNGPVNITDWHRYSFINVDGDFVPYTVGDWEILYIGVDNGCTNFFGRDITLHNKLTDKYYKYRSKINYANFVMEEIKPLMEKLNRMDSESDVISEIKCHMDYASLEAKYKTVLTQIDKYKEQLSEIKKIIEKMV